MPGTSQELISSLLFTLKREQEVARDRARATRYADAVGLEREELPPRTIDLDSAYANAQDARQVAAELHEKILNGEGRNALPLQLRWVAEIREIIQMDVGARKSRARALGEAVSLA